MDGERDARRDDPRLTETEAMEKRRGVAVADGQPIVAQVREEDLEPHEGLRYIARLFKGLAVLVLIMIVAELFIGLRVDGVAALGMLMIEITRLLVFAGLLWGAGDIAMLLIESNHDLRAVRILMGRMNSKLDRLPGPE
jgi:hypothetical protein